MKRLIGRVLAHNFFKNPIFIVGHGRSGTTIIQRALMANPRVLGINFESPMVSRIAFLKSLFLDQDISKIDYYNDSLQVSTKYFDTAIRKLIFESVFGEYYAYRRLYWELRKRKLDYGKVTNWVTKTFPNQSLYNTLTNLYPNSRFIYVVRNGIDVINSATKKDWFKKFSFEELCKSWAHSNEYYKYLLNQNKNRNTLMVKYENFTINTEEVLERIFDFLDVKYDSCSLKFVERNVVGSLDKKDFKVENSRDYFRDRKNPYKLWDSTQKELFALICNEAMEDLNYKTPH